MSFIDKAICVLIAGYACMVLFHLYDWWVCTRIDRKNRREKRR